MLNNELLLMPTYKRNSAHCTITVDKGSSEVYREYGYRKSAYGRLSKTPFWYFGGKQIYLTAFISREYEGSHIDSVLELSDPLTNNFDITIATPPNLDTYEFRFMNTNFSNTRYGPDFSYNVGKRVELTFDPSPDGYL